MKTGLLTSASSKAMTGIDKVSKALMNVPQEEWLFVFKQAQHVASTKLAMKALKSLYKNL